MSNLQALLQPQSVAIVGISQPGRFGGQLYENIAAMGFPGAVYGVNPRYASLYDRPSYPSLSSLPQTPDCVLLAVPNARLVEALREAAECGVKAAVIFANAHGIQDELTAIAQEHEMAICGPNCMGFINFNLRLPVSGYPVLNAPAGHISLISHSGSVWESLVQNNRQVHYNIVISSGNEMVTTLADYLLYLLDEPATRVVGLFMEAVRDPAKFKVALATAVARNIPIVALKVGRSERGAKLAQAHSGALAGTDAAYEALFDYYGVRRVQSPDEMMDTLELLSTGFRPQTRFVSAVLDSGGERALLVDLAETTGVEFAPLSESTKAAIATVIEPGLAPENPLDAWGTGNSSDEIYQTCALALDGDPQTGLTLFAVDLTRGSTLPPTYPDIILPIQHRLTKPLAFLVNISAGASDSMMKQLRDAGIPVLMGTETGLRAVRHLLAYAQFQRQMAGDRPQAANEAFTINRSQFTLHNSLDEYASKVLLAKYGIPVTREAIAVTAAEALQAAQKIGYPVALKTAVSHYQHKSEVNGIHLNLQNAKEVARAYDDLAARLGSRVLVQEMAPSGVELILGMVNDAQFGPMLVIGMGGVLVEVMRDSKLLLLPTTETAVRQALLSLRGAKLLQGVRGRPAVDVEAVVVAAMKLAALTADYAHTLAAIDINPLIVHTNGAIAVDALVIPNLEPRK